MSIDAEERQRSGVIHAVRTSRWSRLTEIKVQQAEDEPPTSVRPRFAWNMGEVSGSLGDLGTFLPHIVGAITVVKMDPTVILGSAESALAWATTSSKSTLIAAFLAAEIAVVRLAGFHVRPAPVLRGMPPAPAQGRSVSPTPIAAPNSRARPSDGHATGSSEHDIDRRSIHGLSRHVA
jgi:hypothetical protein